MPSNGKGNADQQADNSNPEDKWLDFIKTRGMNSEKGEKRQAELTAFMNLPKVSKQSLLSGDLIITKQYTAKAKLDPVARSLRFFYKSMPSIPSATRFSQHVYLVADSERFAHLLDPHCELVPSYEPPEELHMPEAEFCGLVYRFKDQSIAKKASEIAILLASIAIEQRQKTFTGLCSKEDKIYSLFNIPKDMPVLKTAAYIIHQTFFHTPSQPDPDQQMSWCSRWILEICQKAIKECAKSDNQSDYQAILSANGKTMHTKALEAIMNELVRKGLCTIVGRTYTYGIPVGLIQRKNKELSDKDIYKMFIEADLKKLQCKM